MGAALCFYQFTAEVVTPDRMHITTEMNASGREAVKSEMIYIGKQSYARAGDGAWQKDSLDMSDMFSQFRDPKLIDAIAQKAEVKYLGTDTLNGAPMLTYQYQIKDVMGSGKDSVSKIWIGAKDNLQHQVETESDLKQLALFAPICANGQGAHQLGRIPRAFPEIK